MEFIFEMLLEIGAILEDLIRKNRDSSGSMRQE